jgi:uncharacterized membrane protein (UPF0127 family)
VRSPFDAAFLVNDGRVTAAKHGLANRLSKVVLRAEGVLELAAGRLLATNTDVGEVIGFREIDANV